MRILGLDEAGRGSVLGPLVVGAFCYEGEPVDAGALDPLAALGAADSKTLTPARRRAARSRLAQVGVERWVTIPATRIDEGNVNTLEEEAFLTLVAALAPDRVYLDAPVHPAGIPRLRDRLITRSGVRDWVVENKADGRWPVVGAASLVAKTERDDAIDRLTEVLGPIGSGYPSDPATRARLTEWLRTDAPLPDCVRTRWGTLQVLRQQGLW